MNILRRLTCLSIVGKQTPSRRMIEVVIIAAVLIGFLIAMQLVYGQTAGSLEELKNEVVGTDSYRNELVTYIVEHKIDSGMTEEARIGFHYNDSWLHMSDNITALKGADIDVLENLVKEHLALCQGEPKGKMINYTCSFVEENYEKLGLSGMDWLPYRKGIC